MRYSDIQASVKNAMMLRAYVFRWSLPQRPGSHGEYVMRHARQSLSPIVLRCLAACVKRRVAKRWSTRMLRTVLPRERRRTGPAKGAFGTW